MHRRWRGVNDDDGDGHENVPYKVNSHFFKLYQEVGSWLNRAYSISFNSSNVLAKMFCWSWFLKDCIKNQEKKKKVVVLCSSPPQDVKLGIFLRSRAVTAKKCKKSVMNEQSCCFANLDLLLFYRSPCRRRRRCLSSITSAVSMVLNDTPYLHHALVVLYILASLLQNKMVMYPSPRLLSFFLRVISTPTLQHNSIL